MRVALIQMTSTDEVANNLDAARKWVEAAVESGADFVGLPENFAFLRREGKPIPCAQSLDGEIVKTLGEIAREHGIWLLGGSIPEAKGRLHLRSCLRSSSMSSRSFRR